MSGVWVILQFTLWRWLFKACFRRAARSLSFIVFFWRELWVKPVICAVQLRSVRCSGDLAQQVGRGDAPTHSWRHNITRVGSWSSATHNPHAQQERWHAPAHTHWHAICHRSIHACTHTHTHTTTHLMSKEMLSLRIRSLPAELSGAASGELRLTGRADIVWREAG